MSAGSVGTKHLLFMELAYSLISLHKVVLSLVSDDNIYARKSVNYEIMLTENFMPSAVLATEPCFKIIS